MVVRFPLIFVGSQASSLLFLILLSFTCSSFVHLHVYISLLLITTHPTHSTVYFAHAINYSFYVYIGLSYFVICAAYVYIYGTKISHKI